MSNTPTIEDLIFAELADEMEHKPEPEVLIPEIEPEPEVVLSSGPVENMGDGITRQAKPFVEVFGWVPTHVPNFMVNVFTGYDSSPIPDPYLPPKEQLETFVFYAERGRKCNLVGPTGAGKTLMAEFYAAITGRPFLRIEHNQELDKASVFGQVHITNGDTDFVPGDLPQAITSATVVVLDELTRATGPANIIYQRFFDRNEMYMPEMKEAGLKSIKPHENFVICATDNTKGDGEDLDMYPASNVQDAAFRNRFDALIEVPYATQAEEEALCKHLLTVPVPDAVVKSLAQFSFLIHAGCEDRTISTAFSPRQLINICNDLNAKLPIKTSIMNCYINFCSKSEYSDILETYKTAFGEDLI